MISKKGKEIAIVNNARTAENCIACSLNKLFFSKIVEILIRIAAINANINQSMKKSLSSPIKYFLKKLFK